MAKSQLCLHWPVTALDQFQRALDAAPFATVLIEATAVAPFDAQAIIPLIEYAQSKNIAALLVGDAQLARVVKADGVHVPWSKAPDAAYAEARDILGTRFIVGIDAGRSRHDAMQLGEGGAEYIGFGIPPHVEDLEKAISRRFELCAWWADIFEVPVVALDVRTADEAKALSDAGTDFIALRLEPGAGAASIKPFAAVVGL